MPDAAQEIAFVDAFIIPQRRDRYRQFLANRKRRRDILNRLNHMLGLDIIPSLALEIRANRQSSARLLTQRGIKDTDSVSIFSDDPELDGITLELNEALTAVQSGFYGSVICCIPGKLAYYKPESPDYGYILEKPNRGLTGE